MSSQDRSNPGSNDHEKASNTCSRATLTSFAADKDQSRVHLYRVPAGGIQPQVALHDNGILHLVYYQVTRTTEICSMRAPKMVVRPSHPLCRLIVAAVRSRRGRSAARKSRSGKAAGCMSPGTLRPTQARSTLIPENLAHRCFTYASTIRETHSRQRGRSNPASGEGKTKRNTFIPRK
jgi:hypothetical protein